MQTNFEKWKDRYERNRARKDQIERCVQLEVLTEEEYEKIIGEEYNAD
ncbi:XkdX family protein [Salsuginibacillus kocurii]|nr:XkdX family protein [Salsuginibacillus kocurii]